MPIIAGFLYGLIAAAFALVLELLFFSILPLGFFGFLSGVPAPLSLALFSGLSLFALIEESVRILFLTRYEKNVSRTSRAFLDKNIWLIGLVFGLGFASLEALVGSLLGGLPASDVFLPGTGLLHIFLSTGLAFFILRKPLPPFAFRLAFLSAVLLHLFYNLVIFLS